MKRIPATPALTWLTLAALLVPAAAGISSSRRAHAQNSDAALTATETVVSDVNSREVRSLVARNGIILGDSMASPGAVKVDSPAIVVEAFRVRTILI